MYDLIIVGGGPAGATAALYAGRQGMKTLLLEKERFPRDKVCGDALSGKSVAVLRELDLLHKTRHLPGAVIRSITFGSPDSTETNIDFRRSGYGDSLIGFVIRRRIFDHFLFEEARKTVDTCIEGFTVRELILKEGQVSGIRGGQAGCDEEVEYRGRIVLGADGFRSIVSRKTGMYKHEPRHWVVALRCYYQNVKGLTDQIELHYLDEVLPGYFWVFPLENGYANVGIGMLYEYIKRRNVNLRDALHVAIHSPRFRDRFVEAQALEEPVGWNLPVGSKHRRIYGDGFMLLGDAAGLIDPFTGEGIGNAMYSARCAVETAREACEAGDVSAAFLARYDERLWRTIGDEMKVSTRLQQLGRLRFLMNFFIGKAAQNQEVRDIICGMIANTIPKHKLTNPLFYLKLLLK
ncbi:MAG: geranylgeranyl reductase family protein [Candidatus Latescibacteria bacterium]|nr:geranylgeranyl reductase family protein [Candidatus Latescibacterota bacterium]